MTWRTGTTLKRGALAKQSRYCAKVLGRSAGSSGTGDKTNLPNEIILSNYFSVRDGKIASLVVPQPARWLLT